MPLIDARVETDPNGTTWILLRHATGIWLSVRCGVELESVLKATDTPWELVSLGVDEENSIVALFGVGRCSFDIGDSDSTLAAFGFGKWWTRFALTQWYARLVPVVIRQDKKNLARLLMLWDK